MLLNVCVCVYIHSYTNGSNSRSFCRLLCVYKYTHTSIYTYGLELFTYILTELLDHLLYLWNPFMLEHRSASLNDLCVIGMQRRAHSVSVPIGNHQAPFISQ